MADITTRIRTRAGTGIASGTIEIAGKTVRRLGFGAMRLVGPGVWGEPADRGPFIQLMRRVVEPGVDFIDTASVYGPTSARRSSARHRTPTRSTC